MCVKFPELCFSPPVLRSTATGQVACSNPIKIPQEQEGSRGVMFSLYTASPHLNVCSGSRIFPPFLLNSGSKNITFMLIFCLFSLLNGLHILLAENYLFLLQNSVAHRMPSIHGQQLLLRVPYASLQYFPRLNCICSHIRYCQLYLLLYCYNMSFNQYVKQ